LRFAIVRAFLAMTIVNRSDSTTTAMEDDDDDYQNAMYEMNHHDGRKRIDPWSTSGIPYCKRRRLDPSKEFYYSSSSSAPVADVGVKNPNDTPATSNNNIGEEESLHHDYTRQQVCTLNSSIADDCRALVPLLSRKRPASVEPSPFSDVDQHYDSSGWPPTPHRQRQDSFFPLVTWQEEPRRGWPPLEMKYPLPPQLASVHVAPPLSNCRAMVVWTPTPTTTTPPTPPPPTPTSLRLLLPPPAPAGVGRRVPAQIVAGDDDDDVHNRSHRNDGNTPWDDGKDSDDVIMDTSVD
jgi:hypothetical protein